MSSTDRNYVMSPETAEAVRVLLNVCGDTNEVQPTQLANRGQSQGVSGAASGAPVLHVQSSKPGRPQCFEHEETSTSGSGDHHVL